MSQKPVSYPAWHPDRRHGQSSTRRHAPAYYAQGTTGWRAWWTLLHPPYTLMHLSFIVVGAALAPGMQWDRLAWTLLAFLLAMGFAAHALDEWRTRPLNTQIPAVALLATAAIGLTFAVALGIWGTIHYQIPWGLVFIPIGVLLVLGYNLELFGGRLHTDLAFVLAWGAFPVLVAYYAQTGRLDPVAAIAATYAALASAAQRVLSTPARDLRRRTAHVSGTLTREDGTATPITRELLLRPQERGLRLLVATSVVIAILLLLLG